MRWIFRIVGAIAVLIFLGVAVILLIPAERIVQVVTDRITTATGRPVTITGGARPTLWPDLGIVIEGLRIGNPAWAGDTPMITAERVNVGVAWGGLFSGDIRVERAVLDGAQIMLVRAADGRMSWDMGAGGTVQVGLEEALIRDARVRYLDRVAGADWAVSELDATVSLPEVEGAVSIAATARLNGVPLVLDASVQGVADLLAGNARPVEADLRWQGGSTNFIGELALDATMDGVLSLTAEDLSPLVTLSGGDLPALPSGLGRDRVEVTGDFRRAREGSFHLRNAEVRLDETVLAVALDWASGENRPMLRGTITSDAVTLPGLMARGTAVDGWPRDVMDVSGLFATDADLTIRLARLDLGAVVLSEADLRATINRGRLVFDIASLTAYEGQLAGQFVINGRGGLSVGGDLILADAALAPLLGAVAGYERLDGTGSASVEFLGVGNDLHTIMDGLEATGDVTLGQGSFAGLDIDAMTAAFEAGFEGEDRSTLFDRINGEFVIADGVVSGEDLRLDAPWGVMSGAGEVDLAAMTLDYGLAPMALGDRDPVRAQGPWTAPVFAVDTEALVALRERAEAEAEAVRIADEVRAQLEAAQVQAEQVILERGGDFLGVQIDTSGTPAELQRRLEEGVVDVWERLIFGNGGEN